MNMLTFSEVSAVSPIPTQPFVWMAEYFSGGLTEFDLATGTENNLQDIDKDKLIRFGLIGNNRKLWFECIGGTFNITGRRIDIAFESKDGKRYSLTGNGSNMTRDIITFKKAIADVPVGVGSKKASTSRTGSLDSRIVGYYYGYKTQFTIDGFNFTFKPIVSLPLSKAPYISVNIMTDRDLDGRIIFIRNREEIESIDGFLAKDKTSQLNWLIK
ncbi:hypothetical protein [Anaerospora hongkongensis]|uniref:hypothetical protein n=1 Tax=Anaerospora hongkongensis TaxID=244830 RepID=UPI0028A23604|nr:hypothetical protein [Anaerospora hongkongensis]